MTPDLSAWPRLVSRYQVPSTRKAVVQVVSTLAPLVAIVLLMSLIDHPAALLLGVLAAGFLVRTFILMHDCGHGGFFRSRRASDVIGFITGVLTLTPYARWRREHAIHHATSACLDERGTGDIMTLTVREYRALSRWGRIRYRVYRNPFVMLGVGPLWMIVKYRFPTKDMTRTDRASVHATNLAALALFGGWSLLIGPLRVLEIYLPAGLLAASAGIWLFYVQHQFEGTYWARRQDWSYAEAAVLGSSYYRLPRPLDWITGSIGYHHLHHLSPRIPLYNLRRCHEENPVFQRAHVLSLRESLHSFRLKLWDEDEHRMVTLRAA